MRLLPAPLHGDGEAFAADVRAAIASLAADGIRPAALIVDTIFSSDGVIPDPAGFLAPAVAAIRAAGGLFIADEVQPGFGRTGATVRAGLTPTGGVSTISPSTPRRPTLYGHPLNCSVP